MNPHPFLLAATLALPALAAPGSNLRLIDPGDVAPSTAPLLGQERVAGPLSFHLPALALEGELPSPLPLPLDDGGGAGSSIRSDLMPVVAILLSALVGFGTGHLVARDREGFVIFLLVDLVIVALQGVAVWVLPGYWSLGGLAFLLSHIIQVLDVYPKVMGGSRLVERARERGIALAFAGGPDPALPATTRLLAFAF